jgi:hypothetical protein
MAVPAASIWAPPLAATEMWLDPLLSANCPPIAEAVACELL